MPKKKNSNSTAQLFQAEIITAKPKTTTLTANATQKTGKSRGTKKNVSRQYLFAGHEQKLDKLLHLAQIEAQPSAELPTPTVKQPYCLKETYRTILEKFEFRYKQKPTFSTLQELLEGLKPAITGEEMQNYIAIDPKIPPVLVWAPLKNKWIAGYTLCEIVREYMQWTETKYPDKKIIAQVKKLNVLQVNTLQIENEEPFYRFLVNNKLY